MDANHLLKVESGVTGIPVGKTIAVLAEAGDDLATLEIPSLRKVEVLLPPPLLLNLLKSLLQRLSLHQPSLLLPRIPLLNHPMFSPRLISIKPFCLLS